MKVTFLGTGTSCGVPLLGCSCAVCNSTDSRNWRTRPSIVVHLDQGNILIDTTPEMRLQLLREKIGRIDAVLYTHYHADHIFGMDDLRAFPKLLGQPVPVYCEPSVQKVLSQTFPYAFDSLKSNVPHTFLPQLKVETIEENKAFEVLGARILPLRLIHGRIGVLGFRIGSFAYCTDVNLIPEASMAQLKGLSHLVLDALRHRPHPTHLSVQESLEVIGQLQPQRAYLTHINHEIDHEPTEAQLPDHVQLAYDGLSIEVGVG